MDGPRNSLLRNLSPASYEALAEHLVPLVLKLNEEVYRPEETVPFVYFPEDALLSLITDSRDGRSVETSMAGIEGAAGLLEACSSGRSTLRCITQVEGRALRAPSAAVRRLVYGDEAFGRMAWTLIEFQLAESRQSGFCQALHRVESRLARWLLESHERCGGRNPLPMTQEFLASMIGVQRTTVNGIVAQLEKFGLIRNHRGAVEILDLEGLEQSACECRAYTKMQRARLGLTPSA